MGWLSSSPAKTIFPWQKLDSQALWNKLWSDDSSRISVVFKHSTRCGISSMALKTFEQEMQTNESMDFYLLDLLQFREISNAIAESTKVQHQSPQVLVVKNNTVIYTATHHHIDANQISKIS